MDAWRWLLLGVMAGMVSGTARGDGGFGSTGR